LWNHNQEVLLTPFWFIHHQFFVGLAGKKAKSPNSAIAEMGFSLESAYRCPIMFCRHDQIRVSCHPSKCALPLQDALFHKSLVFSYIVFPGL